MDWSRIAVGALLLGLSWPEAAATAELRDDDIRHAVRRALAEGGIQTELPIGVAPATRPTEQPLPRSRKSERSTDPPRPAPLEPRPEPPESLTPVTRFLLWIVVAAAIVWLLFYGARELPYLLSRRQPDPGDSPTPEFAPEKPKSQERAVPEAADRLASAGDYGAAVRVLLHAGLATLGHRPAPSLTSREIVGRVSMPEYSRTALSVIVAAEELSLFAHRPPNDVVYSKCCDSYRRLATPDGGSP